MNNDGDIKLMNKYDEIELMNNDGDCNYYSHES